MSIEQALADARERDIRMADRYLKPRADLVREAFEAMDSGEGDGVGVERARKNAAGTSD